VKETREYIRVFFDKAVFVVMRVGNFELAGSADFVTGNHVFRKQLWAEIQRILVLILDEKFCLRQKTEQ
jgi:hypothetical protein